MSQSTNEQKCVKEMKSGMKDKTVSRIVRTLQIMSAIIGIILTVMSGNYTYMTITISRSIFCFDKQRN